MSLLFIDGCTHYATDDLSVKWDLFASATIVDTNPRRSGSKSIVPYQDLPVQSYPFTLSTFVALGAAVRIGDGMKIGLMSGSQVQVTLCKNGNTLSVYRGESDALLASMDVEGIITSGEWYYIEFGALIHATAGTFEVFLNGVQLAALTMTSQNTKPSTPSGVDRFKLWTTGNQWTDIYVEDSVFLGDCIVETIYPTGAGAHTNFLPSTGSNYENVDDDGDIDGDSTYNHAAAENSKDTFIAANISNRPSSTIAGVALHMTARKDGAGSRVLKPMVRIASLDYLHAADGLILSDVYHGAQRIWDDNPATAAAWSESAVNAAEIGYYLVTGQ